MKRYKLTFSKLISLLILFLGLSVSSGVYQATSAVPYTTEWVYNSNETKDLKLLNFQNSFKAPIQLEFQEFRFNVLLRSEDQITRNAYKAFENLDSSYQNLLILRHSYIGRHSTEPIA